DRPRHVHLPELLPLLILPHLREDQAEVLRSLPRRAQWSQPPSQSATQSPVQSLPQRRERQILVLVDQSQPQSLGDDLARAYGLELLSSRPIGLIGARAELFRVRSGRSEAAALAALQ